MKNEIKIRYIKKSVFEDKSDNITSIKNSDMMYILRFAENNDNEEKHSFRYIKIVNKEAWITPLVHSQFRKSVQYNDIDFLKRRWNYYLRLK